MTHRTLISRPWLFVGLGFGLIGVPIACGSDPVLDFSPEDVGKDCTDAADCQGGLVCAEGACSIPCSEVDDEDCTGKDVCLESGVCSIGVGRVCEDDADCSGATVCSDDGRCAVACEPGTSPAVCLGKVCRADGTCAPSDGLDIGDGEGGAGGNDGGEGCIDVDVTFDPQVPTVMLLIDRSDSMTAAGGFGDAVDDAVEAGDYELGECPNNNDWRWNVVRDVLFHPEKGVVKPLEDRVRFGLSLYTSVQGQVDDEDPEEVDPTKECPILIEVPIALANHAAMLDEYECSDLLNLASDTPTGESLEAAAATLAAFDEPGPKVIVLATDGEPDSCECPDFGDHVPDACKEDGVPDQVKARVVEIAGNIHADDVTIHVINVSAPSATNLQAHLEDVADAGGGNVYPGFNPVELIDAFEEIIEGARSCKIDLDGSIAEGEEDSGTVTLDGTKLELDDEHGYQVNSPTQVELLGDACSTIKSGDHDLRIRFPCDSFVPVPR